MSSLAWIDFDEAERQRAQRIMALFQERESRDELGLGAIRDSIADHLFPGTSTIQTRLRYMLFIPWILRRLEGRDGTAAQLSAEGRAMELRLTDALKAGGETSGIIGRDAGVRLQRLPSSVYWVGLGAWGIRLFQGSRETYYAALPNQRRRHQRPTQAESLEVEVLHAGTWHAGLPPAPSDFLETASFTLTPDEVQFIRDRLIAEAPNALLTWLARQAHNGDCAYIWQHPAYGDFPPAARRLVEHAQMFSGVMHGASLLYNLQLAELRDRQDWVELYRARLAQWIADLDEDATATWSMADFWRDVAHPVHTVRPQLVHFVEEWVALVRSGAEAIPELAAARSLVRERERRLKTAQSRFSNHAARDRWGGASGADRLSFRWSQAQSHLGDLLRGE
ncbi:DUF6361 family protein [Bosea sp. TND4EK4]|uniref:DUF6361 family protein n=1 Tax=Bosea sp. TND4EK4 TaxID=1907408 RepID=UPI0009541697|nr:DUF6361 family protein [Bosea sp. TND4EK4]SIR42162.1 hypothetical protein SAMN05880592_12041 [Bosea sp. TND4EK4]